MKFLGYLFVLALFGANKKTFFDKFSEFSVDIEKVGKLFDKLFRNDTYNESPEFTEEDVRRSNYINKGTVAKYYSKSLRDYILYHNVSSEEEGFVITLHKADQPKDDFDHYSPDDDKEKIPTVLFLPKEGVEINEVENKELNSAISGYVETIQKKIDAKEIGVVKPNEGSSSILEVDDKNDHLFVHPTNKNITAALEELSEPSDSNEIDIKKYSESTEGSYLNPKEKYRGDFNNNEKVQVDETEQHISDYTIDEDCKSSTLVNLQTNSDVTDSIDFDLSKYSDNSIKSLKTKEETGEALQIQNRKKSEPITPADLRKELDISETHNDNSNESVIEEVPDGDSFENISASPTLEIIDDDTLVEDDPSYVDDLDESFIEDEDWDDDEEGDDET